MVVADWWKWNYRILCRIAEIVVLCERRAGWLLAKYVTSSSSGTSNKNNTDEDGRDEMTKEEKEKVNEEKKMIWWITFELFCERIKMAKIVTLVLGYWDRATTDTAAMVW